jgi:mannosyltransferase OCH1-like enzyme
MNKTIHQVYGVFNDGIVIEDIDIFNKQTTKTKQFCDKHNINYKMWNYNMCEELINKYPQYRKLYDNFKQSIQRADFIRYLILYDQGGIYIDCDIHPIADISELFNMNQFFVRWNDDKRMLPYNAVLGSKPNNPLYEAIFQEIIDSVIEKDKIDIYKKWIGRYVFQTTGHFMLQRVIKRYKHMDDIFKLDILKINTKDGKVVSGDNPLFEDYNASIWYQGK